ncbi:Inactivation-no-after-potential D protein [Papilio machaon]|uniref:Inactivation-no-after-potential D protein n=1 Tax=Papilio machaon TaxID=76193 RepID=A0A0N0PBZ4_PAPMA|nr:Inactivation-no-after-potential D protein [Papilio machaon]
MQVNGIVLHGRCHLNASAIIKGLVGPVFKIILLRRKSALEDVAVKPLTQFPVALDEELNLDNRETSRSESHLSGIDGRLPKARLSDMCRITMVSFTVRTSDKCTYVNRKTLVHGGIRTLDLQTASQVLHP